MKTIFCLMGKSGTGKDTLAKILVNDKSLDIKSLVPYTTRPKRPTETEGVEYHFISNEQFKAFLESNKVVEYREYPHYVDGNVTYATIDDTGADGYYLLITTPEAFSTIKKYFQSKDARCVGLYIDVSTIERLRRCYEREVASNGDKYRELIRRFLADENDYADMEVFGLDFCNWDYRISGDKSIEEVRKDVEKIINREKEYKAPTCTSCIYYEPHKCRMGQVNYSEETPICEFAETYRNFA